MNIIDGKSLSRKILAEIKDEVSGLSFAPIFCDVLVGDNPVSKQYVQKKAETARSVGMKFQEADFQADILTEELVSEIHKLNQIENMCGIIVQLPLPESIDKRRVLDAIDPSLDVDALGSYMGEKFYRGEPELILPTAQSCMQLLDSTGITLTDKKIVVLGRGELVGRPVAEMLRMRGVEPEIVSSQTENKEDIIKTADIVISGIGKAKYIKGDMIKDGVVLIDAGTSEEGSSVVGDVDLDSVKDKASFVSPVPGGVGPMTIAMLLRNVLQVAKTKNGK